MDEQLAANAPVQPAESDTAVVDETSTEYVNRWNRLLSTTNWEKGRIISHWRGQVMEAGGPPQACSDEAWSRRVGGVSPQHVGRLRRVYEQFGEVYEQYAGLYWSHFQAALDWHDAEMWLQGAVESGWTVAQMRTQRWETLGAPADKKPKPEDVIVAELDEDVDAAVDESPQEMLGESMGVVQSLDSEEALPIDTRHAEPLGPSAPPTEETMVAEPFRPFEDLPNLPDDLAEALDAFRLAILKHKLSGWQAISCEQVLASLDALRQLALAPSDD